MGIIKLTQQFVSSVAPGRMFRALFLDAHNLCPKLMFSSIKSIEYLEGDGDAGSIKQINLTEESPLKLLKYRIDAMDKENFMCKYTLIESDILGDKLESIVYEVKFSSYGSGSVCKVFSEYHTNGDYEIKEEDIEAGKDRAIGVYEVVEAYLMAHPKAYV